MNSTQGWRAVPRHLAEAISTWRGQCYTWSTATTFELPGSQLGPFGLAWNEASQSVYVLTVGKLTAYRLDGTVARQLETFVIPWGVSAARTTEDVVVLGDSLQWIRAGVTRSDFVVALDSVSIIMSDSVAMAEDGSCMALSYHGTIYLLDDLGRVMRTMATQDPTGCYFAMFDRLHTHVSPGGTRLAAMAVSGTFVVVDERRVHCGSFDSAGGVTRISVHGPVVWVMLVHGIAAVRIQDGAVLKYTHHLRDMVQWYAWGSSMDVTTRGSWIFSMQQSITILR